MRDHVFLLRLGMIGEEFKSPGQHLLSHLEGNGAWKNPDGAQAQKERLRAKRDKEMTLQENQGQEEQAQEEQEQDDQTSEMESGFSMTM